MPADALWQFAVRRQPDLQPRQCFDERKHRQLKKRGFSGWL